jgi:hypothetical protein
VVSGHPLDQQQGLPASPALVVELATVDVDVRHGAERYTGNASWGADSSA